MTAPPHGSLRRRSVLRALGAAGLRLVLPAAWIAAVPRRAAAAEADLTHFDVIRDEEGVFLTFTVNFELAKGPEEALARAVPLFFVAEAEVFRSRWYWRDRDHPEPHRLRAGDHRGAVLRAVPVAGEQVRAVVMLSLIHI